MSPRCVLFAAVIGPSFLLQTIVSAQTLSANTNRSSARSLKSFIASGSANLIGSNSRTSFIGGGQSNIIANFSGGSFIGGGLRNRLLAIDRLPGFSLKPSAATIGGGYANFIAEGSGGSVIAGGWSNSVTAETPISIGPATTPWLPPAATVGGGYMNTAAGQIATVGGGQDNTNSGYAGFIGGGLANTIDNSATNSVVAGGSANYISGGSAGSGDSFIGGGSFNLITNTNSADGFGSRGSVIAGGVRNRTAASDYLTVLPGGPPIRTVVWPATATVGGGFGNAANGAHSTVGGGFSNSASGLSAMLGGGSLNAASGNFSFLGGGFSNSVSGGKATVGGGESNAATWDLATVGGGQGNTASQLGATVPGGTRNTAGGYNSFAAGSDAKATNNASFVWGNPDMVTVSTNDFSWTVRAQGGVRFITTKVDSAAVSNLGNFYNASNGASFYTNGVYLAPGSGAWASLSDSNAKTKVAAIKPRKILSKLAALPVTEWEYKVDPNRRYIGPMAQDFHAAFGLGSDDKSITTLDSDGVMYAAIQGLVEELKERDKAMAARDETIEELKTKLEAFEKRLDSLPPAPAR